MLVRLENGRFSGGHGKPVADDRNPRENSGVTLGLRLAEVPIHRCTQGAGGRFRTGTEHRNAARRSLTACGWFGQGQAALRAFLGLLGAFVAFGAAFATSPSFLA